MEMSHPLEKRNSSSSIHKPSTPKRFPIEPSTSGTDTARRRRVEDESSIGKQYLFGEVLGTGAFGVVKEVTNRLTQQQFAMKIIAKDKPGSSSIQLLEREVEVLKRVNHPHIIQLEEVFETATKMYLIMELCEGGEVSKELRKKGFFKEEEAKIIMRELTEAVVYMHDNDMVHRDLKLENILLSTPDSPDSFNIKVTDFGLAHMKGLEGCDDLMYSKCGTLYYMAPEVLNNKHEYTKMCDVWSVGVIMYTLLCGTVPFKSDYASKLTELISQGELNFQEIEWINVSNTAKELIRFMLCVNTSERYTARRVLDHSWFTGTEVRGIDALQLMRDLDSESRKSVNSNRSRPTSILETVPEFVISKNSTEDLQHLSVQSSPTKKIIHSRTQSSGNLASYSSSSMRNKATAVLHTELPIHPVSSSTSANGKSKLSHGSGSGSRSSLQSPRRSGSASNITTSGAKKHRKS